MKRLIACILIATGFASAAQACRLNSNWNQYEAFATRRQPADYGRAAYVERVEIEPPPPPACPRPSDDDNHHPSPDNPCDNPLAGGLAFTAHVLEHLKGSGPERYALVHQASGLTPILDNGWRVLWDPRTAYAENHAWFSIWQKARAESGHMADAFWDSAELGPQGLGSGACGTDWSIDYRLPYLVFRDRNGAIIAMEAVMRDDDALLARLRAAERGEAPTPSRTVAEFFKSAGALGLLKIEDCDRRKPKIRVLRWAGAKRDDEEWSYIPDWVRWRGKRCAQTEVLVAFTVFHDAAPQPIDLVWGRSAAPEADLSRVTDRTLSVWGSDLPRPAEVQHNTLRLDELITGFRLIGPASISVDQAFSWFDESHRSRVGEPP